MPLEPDSEAGLSETNNLRVQVEVDAIQIAKPTQLPSQTSLPSFPSRETTSRDFNKFEREKSLKLTEKENAFKPTDSENGVRWQTHERVDVEWRNSVWDTAVSCDRLERSSPKCIVAAIPL